MVLLINKIQTEKARSFIVFILNYLPNVLIMRLYTTSELCKARANHCSNHVAVENHINIEGMQTLSRTIRN